MLCAGAAAQGRTRGLNFFVWNFAWDRLASRLYAATATTFLMKRYGFFVSNGNTSKQRNIPNNLGQYYDDALAPYIWFSPSLPHLPLDKMAAILQTTFSNAFSWMKNFVFRFEFPWSSSLMVQLAMSQHWFKYWLGTEQATSHYLNQCWPSSPMHICGITRVRWVNSLWPSDVIWRHGSGSTMA